MYVPPYEYVLHKLGESKGEVSDEDTVKVPLKFIKMLLQFALANRAFDEEAYLRAYADVATAVTDGHFPDGLSHFLAVGYFEGRTDGSSLVDEGWYKREYPDVLPAIEGGLVPSAKEHFRLHGAIEGRSPDEDTLIDVSFWHRNLKS